MHDLSEADKNRKQTKQGPAASGRAIDCIARETCPVLKCVYPEYIRPAATEDTLRQEGKQTDRRIKQEVRLSRTDIKTGPDCPAPFRLLQQARKPALSGITESP